MSRSTSTLKHGDLMKYKQNTRNQECAPGKQFVQDDIANSKRTKIQADKEIQILGWKDQG